MNLSDELSRISNEPFINKRDEIIKNISSLIKDRARQGYGYILIGMPTLSIEKKVIEWGNSEGISSSHQSYGLTGQGVLFVWGYPPSIICGANAILTMDGTIE